MSSLNRVSFQSEQLSVSMITLLVIVIVSFIPFLTLPVSTQAQSDPLNSAYKPTIDTNPSDYPANIWITDTMQKVRQDSGSPGSAHWGTFYGTQNEFVDFQVHINASAGAIPNLSVTTSSFVKSTGPGGSNTISNQTSSLPFPITVYREAYMNVTGYVSSTVNTFYGTTGYYPDILIPAVDPYWGQTTNAWPFNVSSGNNQSAWVDVLIPPTAPSGYYLGSVTVKSGSTTLATMPVVIGVWQWPSAGYMPATPTLKTMLWNWGYNGLCIQMYNPGTTTVSCGSYPGGGITGDPNTAIWLDADLIAKDNRYDAGGIENVFPNTGSFSNYTTYVGPIMNGTCNLHAGGGSTCPVLSGSKNTTKEISLAGGVASSGIWSNFQTNFVTNGWGTAGTLPLFDYLVDEPHTSGDFATLISNAATRHGYLNPGIPELVTTDLVTATTYSAQNSIDIMVSNNVVLEPIGGPLQNLTNYATWLTGSTDGIPRHWWAYQGCTSGGTCGNGYPGDSTYTYSNYDVDGKPAANRAFEWLTYLHGQSGELYYAGDVCDTTTSYPATTCGVTPINPTSPKDPWVSIYAFGNWGDGTLFYAGNVKPGSPGYMGTGVTTPIILPSLRLKHIRDGVQDYEYLNVLNNHGQGALVTTEINSWITNSYTFETTGSGLEAARSALGTAMHQLTYHSVVLLPPPGLSVTVH